MSVMRNAIYGCMRDLRKEGNVVCATFNFGLSFIGFNGHFPENPVLPGMLIVQSIIIMLEDNYNIKIRIVEIENAKFIAVIKNDEDISFASTVAMIENDEFIVKTNITRDNKKVAVVKLRVRVYKNGETNETL